MTKEETRIEIVAMLKSYGFDEEEDRTFRAKRLHEYNSRHVQHTDSCHLYDVSPFRRNDKSGARGGLSGFEECKWPNATNRRDGVLCYRPTVPKSIGRY
jgi:hypothetical protein